jgi:hypothetical protein
MYAEPRCLVCSVYSYARPTEQNLIKSNGSRVMMWHRSKNNLIISETDLRKRCIGNRNLFHFSLKHQFKIFLCCYIFLAIYSPDAHRKVHCKCFFFVLRWSTWEMEVIRKKKELHLEFKVLKTAVMKDSVFWVIMPCCPLKANRRSKGTYCLPSFVYVLSPVVFVTTM